MWHKNSARGKVVQVKHESCAATNRHLVWSTALLICCRELIWSPLQCTWVCRICVRKYAGAVIEFFFFFFCHDLKVHTDRHFHTSMYTKHCPTQRKSHTHSLARTPSTHTHKHRLSFFSVSTRQIDAHEDDVNAVAFADSSSQLLFSGSDDALCKVWDRRTLREDRPQPVGQLAGHRDGITFIHSKVGGRRE